MEKKYLVVIGISAVLLALAILLITNTDLALTVSSQIQQGGSTGGGGGA